MRYQLGHPPGQCCPLTIAGHTEFVVLASNGIHTVSIDFCGCFNAPHPRDQIMEVGWWPSTPLEPQTAATMELLHRFHLVNLQARSPPTDYYRALEQLTNGFGLCKLPVSCDPFSSIPIDTSSRTDYPNGCLWCASGAISRWQSALGVDMILQVFRQQHRGS